MSDLPVETIAAMAALRIEEGFTIWQKWDCLHCGSRQTMADPNLLFRTGRCQACDKVSPIAVCGFMMAKGDIVDELAESIRSA